MSGGDDTENSGRERRWRAQLSAEDAALWDYVSHTIEPARGKPRVRIRGTAPDAPPKDLTTDDWLDLFAERSHAVASPRPSRQAPPPPTKQSAKLRTASTAAMPPTAPVYAPASPPRQQPVQPLALERRKSRKIAKGTEEIEARLDLHGLTQDEAHRALEMFLRRCHNDGIRIVIVITGKGGPRVEGRESKPEMFSWGERERGVLRRMVPLWLDGPSLRPIVIGYSAAHLRHGGGGALYVTLRRGR